MTVQDRFLSGVRHFKSLSDLAIWHDRGSFEYVSTTGKILLSAIRDEMGPLTMADMRAISTRDLVDASILLHGVYTHHLPMLQYLQSVGARAITLELWLIVFEHELARRGVSDNRGSHAQS